MADDVVAGSAAVAGTVSGKPGPTRPMRLQLPTERADLRVTWHRPDDVFTVTMWHGRECVASAPLSPPDAANLSAFLVQHLGDRAALGSTARGVASTDRGVVADTDRGLSGWIGRLRRRLSR